MASESGSAAGARSVEHVEYPPVLTAAMAAGLLQVHVEYLRKLVREGKVPCHRFPGGRELRFLRDELLEWLAAQPGVEPGPQSAEPAHAPASPASTAT